MATCSESSFLRQLSERNLTSKSKRWGGGGGGDGYSRNYNVIEEMGGGAEKRMMVVVDESLHSKHAMLWALTHVANKGDTLTLLQFIPKQTLRSSSAPANHLVTSLANLCNASKPQVQVEALVIELGLGGPKLKLATVVSQVKKLEVSVLILGQKNSSPFLHCLGGMSSSEKFVEECIKTVECLTIGVRKQSKGIGGYLISTRWRKDFWLLA